MDTSFLLRHGASMKFQKKKGSFLSFGVSNKSFVFFKHLLLKRFQFSKIFFQHVALLCHGVSQCQITVSSVLVGSQGPCTFYFIITFLFSTPSVYIPYNYSIQFQHRWPLSAYFAKVVWKKYATPLAEHSTSVYCLQRQLGEKEELFWRAN